MKKRPLGRRRGYKIDIVVGCLPPKLHRKKNQNNRALCIYKNDRRTYEYIPKPYTTKALKRVLYIHKGFKIFNLFDEYILNSL